MERGRLRKGALVNRRSESGRNSRNIKRKSRSGVVHGVHVVRVKGALQVSEFTSPAARFELNRINGKYKDILK